MPEPTELLNEGRRCERLGVLDRALESYRAVADGAHDPALVSEALAHEADVLRTLCDWDGALDAARRAQGAAKIANRDDRLLSAIIAEANVLMCRGDFDEAAKLFRYVLDTASDEQTRGIALQNIGSMLAQQGHLGAAERAFAESFGCFHRVGYERGEAIALNNHGRVCLDRGNMELAEELLARALELAREVEDAEVCALATLNYGEALAARRDFVRAHDFVSQAFGYFSTSGNRWRQVECLRLIGTINERCGDCIDAIRCYERALSLAQDIHAYGELSILRDALSRARKTTGRARL